MIAYNHSDHHQQTNNQSGQMPFLLPSQQYQSTEGSWVSWYQNTKPFCVFLQQGDDGGGSSDIWNSETYVNNLYLAPVRSQPPPKCVVGTAYRKNFMMLYNHFYLYNWELWNYIYAVLYWAPCRLRGCKNRPAPFPGRMS